MAGKKKLDRQRSSFGKYLLGLRTKAELGPTEAYKKLGLKGRHILDDYEIGKVTPRYPTLLRMSQVYHAPLDDILRKAYWPQLILLPLDFFINLDQLDPLTTENLITQIEEGLSEFERKELTKFVEGLLCKRGAVGHKSDVAAPIARFSTRAKPREDTLA